MRPALHAEWTKLRTIPGPAWLLLGTVAATIALGAEATAVVAGTAGSGDWTRIGLLGVELGQVPVAVLAVLVVGSEFPARLIRTTLTAVPHRVTVLAAKAVVLAGVVTVAGTTAVLGSLAAGRLILARHGITASPGSAVPSLGDGPTLRAAAGSVLYLALIALLGLGIATAVRNSAASIGGVLGLLYLLPVVSRAVGDPHWQRRLEQIGPMTAGLAVQPPPTSTACPSPRGPVSASPPGGPPPRSWPVACCCAPATPDTGSSRSPAGSDVAGGRPVSRSRLLSGCWRQPM